MSERRSASMRALALALTGLLVLAGALGGSIWFLGRDSQARTAAGIYAEKVAAALAEGTLPPDLRDADRAALQEDYAMALRGMGELRPKVSVASVKLSGNERTGVISFDQVWKIHADKAAWTYRTTMPIAAVNDGDGVTWRGTWSHAVIAAGLRDGERLSAEREVAVRADILDGDEQPLVTARPVTRVGLDKQRERDTDTLLASAKALATRVGIDEQAYVEAVAAAGPRAFVEAIVYRDSSADLISLSEDAGDFPGLRLVAGELPLAPYARFARPILGTVGPVTAEMIEKSGGVLRPGTVAGLSGLQQAQNDRLAGRDGFRVSAISEGEDARQLFAVTARQGQPVQLALLPDYQEAAELALDAVATRGASAIVAIRPSDMQVLAAASGAGSQGYSTATLGQYAPGSTFKLVTALALMRAGVGADAAVECAETVTVDGRSFRNYTDYPAARLGRISLKRAMANSCNTALIRASASLPPAALAQAAASLGLTSSPAAGVPAAMASVPREVSGVDLAAASIGQGTTVATPLAIATMAATIARDEAGSPLVVLDPPTDPAAPDASPPLTAAEGKALRSMMRAVVTEGSASFLRDLPGKPVLAKTGTAEYDSGNPPPTHAWMVAIKGNLAVAVFVEKGQSGSRTAGPVLEDFLRRVAA